MSYRAPRFEPLEDRCLLSVSPYPELPGLKLVDPRPDQFAGQVVYLDFDGAQDVTYNGPVVVEGIDIPAFQAPGELAGQEQEIIAEIVAQLEATFAGTGVVFTTAKPAAGVEYSTIFIGGDDSAFADYGSFLGLAEEVDVGNVNRSDGAIVFASSLQGGMTPAERNIATETADLAAHELAHLLGYQHDEAAAQSGEQNSVLDDVAYGVTFIAHGASFSGARPAWTIGMASAIADRIVTEHHDAYGQDGASADDVVTLEATVSVAKGELSFDGFSYLSPPPSGSMVDAIAGSLDGEVIVVINWSEASNPLTANYNTDNVAEVLVNDGLLATEIGSRLLAAPIHLIGHSRGASLIAATAERLGERNIWVEQLTFLDPHPTSTATKTDWGYDGFSVPENVYFADNYYQLGGLLKGRSIDGATNTQLNDDSLDDLYADTTHSAVHLWYQGTIDVVGGFSDNEYVVPESEASRWYAYDMYVSFDHDYQRERTGYNLSRVSDGSQPGGGIGNTFCGYGNRQPVATVGSQWANARDVGVYGHSRNVSHGDRLSVLYWYEVPTGVTITQRFYLDGDHNPYNGKMTPLGDGTPSSTPYTFDTFSGVVPSSVAAGSYFVVAKVTCNGHDRYFYAPERVTVASSLYTITASHGEHGRIDPEGTFQVAQGDTMTLTATPDGGYVVDKWYVKGVHQSGFDGQNVVSTQVDFGGPVLVTFKPVQADGTITVTSPAGGSRWAQRSTMAITWESENLSGNVKVELYKDGMWARTIRDAVSVASGGCLWNVSGSLDVDDGYQIRITSLEFGVDRLSESFRVLPEEVISGPIEVNTIAKLKKIGSGETFDGRVYADDADYVLTANIDARSEDFPALRQFKGTLNGRAHLIYNLTFGSDDRVGVAIFSEISNEAVIENLTLRVQEVDGLYDVAALAVTNFGTIRDVHVVLDDWIAAHNDAGEWGFAGGLVAENAASGKILNCSVQRGPTTQYAEVKTRAEYTGGIAGYNYGLIRWSWVTGIEINGNHYTGGIAGENAGTIRECYVSAERVYGGPYSGGVAGENFGGNVVDCLVDAAVNGSNESGGIVGVNSGTVSQCLFSGVFVSPNTYRGALVGTNRNALKDSFWNIQTTGFGASQPTGSYSSSPATNCFGLSTAALQHGATYEPSGWDFEQVWGIEEGSSYPQLLGARASLTENPGVVTASQGLPGKVDVSWTQVAGARAYAVYRADSVAGSRTLLGFTAGLTFGDRSALPDETQYYFVTAAYSTIGAGEAIGSAVNYAAGSCRFQADAPAEPCASTNLEGMVCVEWSAVSGAGYYRVYRSNSETGVKAPLTGWLDGAHDYFDSETVMGQEYCYWITASVDSAGETESEFSLFAIGREGEPEIRIEPGAYDFGRQRIGIPVSHSFTVYNDGDVGLIVDQASVSAAFQLAPSNEAGNPTDDWTVPAHGSKQIAVVFAPDAGGAFNASLVLHSNDPGQTVYTIALSGTGNFSPSATIDIITPNPAEPTSDIVQLTGSANDADGTVVAYEWRSSLDGSLGTSETIEIGANGLTVGAHTISFRTADNEGVWSDWATSSLTVNNARPTAIITGVPTENVPPGSTHLITLDGHDNDEVGKSIVAWHLQLDGATYDGTALTGFTITAPQGTGDYEVKLRVRDDEDSWSDWVGATLRVVNSQPTVATDATAAPAVVNGSITALAVLGADDGGEPNLTYTWATTGTPPAAVTFSTNGTNDSKNTTATFVKAGTYAFQVTISDAGGLTATSSVNVTVNPSLTSITVTPARARLDHRQVQQFRATSYDQFGTALTSQPEYDWNSTAGTISSTGLLTAPDIFVVNGVVTASSGGMSGTATFTVGNESPSASVATPSGMQSGNVTISYSLTDQESDACSVIVQYSPNGGVDWYLATPGSGGDGTLGLQSAPSGVTHAYAWDSVADLGTTINAYVMIRITPSDAGGAGTAGTSGQFTVGTVARCTTVGLYDPDTCIFYLRDSNSTGPADYSFGYGNPALQWTCLVGDWDGAGGDTIGFFDPVASVWYLRDSLTTGYADWTFGFGAPELTHGHGDANWIPLVGDWDGDGTDTIGLFDPATCTWYLRNSLTVGYADWTIGYGAPSLTVGHGDGNWQPLVGDWDGDGTDTIGLFDPVGCVWYLKNSLTTGIADYTFACGNPPSVTGNGADNWRAIVGDWDGAEGDSIGFFDPASSVFMLRNALTTGGADLTFGYGVPGEGWLPLVGAWQTPASKAVGQVNLAELVARQLCATEADDLDAFFSELGASKDEFREGWW